MYQLIHFLRGYVIIKVWGFSPERFVNLCSHHNIMLWNMKAVYDGEECYYVMHISISGFWKLKGITKKTGTRVAILQKRGLPFLLPTLQAKKIFVVGAMVCLLFLFWTTGYLWSIDISGNYTITDDMFLEYLEQKEIHAGIRSSKIHVEELEADIRNTYDIVTWVSIEIRGTRLVVQIKENELLNHTGTKEQEEREGMYQVQTASEEGTIQKMITRSGVPLVKIGDEVKKGDILIEGRVPIYDEEGNVARYQIVQPDGDIILKSRVQIKEKIAHTYHKKMYTGEQNKRNFIWIGNHRFWLPFWRQTYDSCDVITQYQELTLFGSLHLQVWYGSCMTREYQEKELQYETVDVKKIFSEKLLQNIESLEEKGVQIIEKNVTINKYENVWAMSGYFTVYTRTGRLQWKSLNIE